MTSVRELVFDDLFRMNRILLDPLTEVYSLSFFMNRILEYPRLAEVAVAPNEQLMGAMLSTRTVDNEIMSDGKDLDLAISHGHVCTLSIDHEFRRLGLATLMMKRLNDHLDLKHDSYVDLFVRSRNRGAIRFYELLGYVKYRWIPYFYGNDHGYEMRCPLSRDVQRSCLLDKGFLIDDFYKAGQQLLEQMKEFLMRAKNAIWPIK